MNSRIRVVRVLLIVFTLVVSALLLLVFFASSKLIKSKPQVTPQSSDLLHLSSDIHNQSPSDSNHIQINSSNPDPLYPSTPPQPPSPNTNNNNNTTTQSSRNQSSDSPPILAEFSSSKPTYDLLLSKFKPIFSKSSFFSTEPVHRLPPSVPRVILVPELSSYAGYGNQIQFLYQYIAIAMCMDFDMVIPPIGFIKHKKTQGGLTAEAQSYYDLDRLSKSVSVRHFESACRQCVEFQVLPYTAKTRRYSGRNLTQPLSDTRYDTNVFGNLSVEYIGNESGMHLWTDFYSNLIVNRQSQCGNRDRCVFFSHNTVKFPDIYNDIHKCAESAYAIAKQAVLPSQLLFQLAHGLLPPKFLMNSTMVIHLRYFAGEYGIDKEQCLSGKNICFGRNSQTVIEMRAFNETVYQYAESLNCTRVFPILPHFAGENVKKNLAKTLGLKYEDLISSKGLNADVELLVERALAIEARELLAETSGTSFTLTVDFQRNALEKPMARSLESLFNRVTNLQRPSNQ
uniref:O-fucosyltransferase family protein n=1 Tax=Timspurckia oligopyrenoides TaxID=708627 RepID=A0A6T6MKS4_9RHOD|mmetsp:Transcript_4487/g.7865  ORF Transcript_4487/g.7865 Transcript_4487/m.7865 type:complete len:511 (+) Transcript_4487:1321-2853(+)